VWQDESGKGKGNKAGRVESEEEGREEGKGDAPNSTKCPIREEIERRAEKIRVSA
jgi:hypothetical protein